MKKWQVVDIQCWLNYNWWNCKLVKYQSDEKHNPKWQVVMVGWQNVKSTKWRVDKMSWHQSSISTYLFVGGSTVAASVAGAWPWHQLIIGKKSGQLWDVPRNLVEKLLTEWHLVDLSMILTDVGCRNEYNFNVKRGLIATLIRFRTSF